MNAQGVVCSHPRKGEAVCDDEEALCASTPPTIARLYTCGARPRSSHAPLRMLECILLLHLRALCCAFLTWGACLLLLLLPACQAACGDVPAAAWPRNTGKSCGTGAARGAPSTSSAVTQQQQQQQQKDVGSPNAKPAVMRSYILR
jgi:hypothetical protein